MRRRAACAIAVVAFFASRAARAESDAGAPRSIRGCVESLPNGAQRPQITDVFPGRGTSGYAATLEVTVEHGKGESVLPHGLELQSAGDAAKALREAGFVIPDQDGGAGARLEPLPADPKRANVARTKLALPLVPLPKEPGRHVLELPPLPVVVSRANGDLATVCTAPHVITVDDPIASTPEAKPKPNPPARKQREEWTALENALAWTAAGVVLASIAAFLLYRWSRRPRPVPPPPPPRPPWEVALEKLDEVRHAGLLETGRFSEYFDRVNDAVRCYLGDRYGFDGLESTTDEIMHAMERVPHFGLALPEIKLFLQECDLVKFANMTPSTDECTKALVSGETIVRATMPKEKAFTEPQPPQEVRP